jgi:Zn ribbon nucleic-acid-binding protein
MKTYKVLTCQKCNARVTIRGWRETQPEPIECPKCGIPYTYRKPAADPDANVKINLYYQDGEYLTGHTVHGDEAKLLEKIGLAKYVDGWGYLVNDATVKSLGTEFMYEQALDLARPALEAKEAARNAEVVARENIFAEAARNGQPVVLDEYSDDCNDPREECSLDNVTIYAMPNGTTKTVRSHTY